jgi:hypothetical protein
MVSQRRPPEHWNAYRPSYDSTPRPQQGPPACSPAVFEAQNRDAPTFSRGRNSRRAPQSDSANPNEIPLGPSRHRQPSYEKSNFEGGIGSRSPDVNLNYRPDTDRHASHNSSQHYANNSRRLSPKNPDHIAEPDRRAFHDISEYSFVGTGPHDYSKEAPNIASNHHIPSNDSDHYDDPSGRDPLSPSSYHGILLWDQSLEDLMARTTRAYDLVINYARDSCGGHRWTPHDSAHVRTIGKDLHNNVRVLKYWQRCDPEDIDWAQIRLDAANVRLLCEDVQRAICQTENVHGTQSMHVDGGREKAENKSADEIERNEGEKQYGKRNSSISTKHTNHPSHTISRRRRTRTRASEQRGREGAGTDSFRPGRAGFAGRLGRYTLHY